MKQEDLEVLCVSVWPTSTSAAAVPGGGDAGDQVGAGVLGRERLKRLAQAAPIAPERIACVQRAIPPTGRPKGPLIPHQVAEQRQRMRQAQAIAGRIDRAKQLLLQLCKTDCARLRRIYSRACSSAGWPGGRAQSRRPAHGCAPSALLRQAGRPRYALSLTRRHDDTVAR